MWKYRDQTCFSCINIRQVLWKPPASVFNTSLRTWRMLMHWKTMFDCYYCIKTENICYISRYFLHYFVSPFHQCIANAISMDYARSRSGQYTSRDGSNSVAPVQAYWKLCSAWITSFIHGFLPVNAWLLITCGTAFYAISDKSRHQRTACKRAVLMTSHVNLLLLRSEAK